MLIETEATPNPASLKFLPGQRVMGEGALDLRSAAEADARSPLAQGLFQLHGVAGVFLGADFVTVTKAEDAAWDQLKPAVLGTLLDHFLSGRPVLVPGQSADAAASQGIFDPEDAEIVDQIKEILETRVRPAVANDGGDIVFHGFERGVVTLHMQGSCAGCPSSTATLKAGIENLLRYYVPEVTEVRAVAA